ncbi:hypothetical protein [Aquimarina sp. 2201CG5-10]|uniref:TapB family protein n=1 Tax=Aquimarina callyspongiae TaxID=3098150 RepID=UPI002AB463D1|nr:hypothetical protein [Aquimarina sp. 2201CG5-10]MDY8136192.1 hypothetical protein [Aquimarina sp. 2201CG5-10]
MNNLLKTGFLILFIFGLKSSLLAQECKATLFAKEGAVLTYTEYNKKGKKLSSTTHKTLSVSENEGLYKILIEAQVKNEKDQETFSTQYGATCQDGLFTMDMLRFFNYDKLAEYKDKGLELKIDGDVLEFPYNSIVGDQLGDGNINIKVNNKGFTLVTLTFNVFNRKIVSEENITTPAGTFLCQKVSFDFESKFGIIKVKGTGVEWYHDNVVIIKSESYNKKGKLIGYTELTGLQ